MKRKKLTPKQMAQRLLEEADNCADIAFSANTSICSHLITLAREAADMLTNLASKKQGTSYYKRADELAASQRLK